MATDLAMSIVIATMTVMGLPTDDRNSLAEIYCGTENGRWRHLGVLFDGLF